jgi:hypothetical protein
MRKRLLKLTAVTLCLSILILSVPAFAGERMGPKFNFTDFIKAQIVSMLHFFHIMPIERPLPPDQISNDSVTPIKVTGQLDIGRVSEDD